ncbi:Ubiquitin carboxyl-terminal hydrolase 2 [Pichia kudriavzevii]|uniref:ubiquitinyl hydrolase 1 n=1 Tax=Pichia kudriavzevii TaxID=4909 RepID=A0A1V2LS60_PICKU|nr:Ubiquitin carboxyl-terminal hydrolase 2 [Pichia kudriavzevii]
MGDVNPFSDSGENNESIGINPSNIPKVPVVQYDEKDEDEEMGVFSAEESNSVQLDNGELSLGEENVEEEQEISPFEYEFSSALCLKSSDRILDDLRSDPLFLLKQQDGVISLPTINYAKQLSQNGASTMKYQPVYWDTKNPDFGSYRTIELDGNTSLATFTGLLVPCDSHSLFEDSVIYHYCIKIKYYNDRINVKNSFYGFHDSQLSDSDRIYIEPEDILCAAGEIPKESIDILLKSLPKVVDSGNFISKETGTVIRVEVYSSILDHSDLELFSLTEIQTRVAKFNSQEPEGQSFGNALTPHDSFLKFRSVLTGAIKQTDERDLKKIDVQKKFLQVSIDIDLLLDKFFFSLDNENNSPCIYPVIISKLGEYSFVYENFLRRAANEAAYFAAITSPNQYDFSNSFSNSFESVFNVLHEFDSQQQNYNWLKWNDKYYNEASIVLSICPHYNDQLIINMYQNLTTHDPVNSPIYFDALTYFVTSRYSDDLPYYVTILKEKGILGFGELKGCFDRFGFHISSCDTLDSITDEQLLLAYQNQLIVATSKYEKVTFRDCLAKIAKYRSSEYLQRYLNTEPFFDLLDAYQLLEIEPNLDDSLLITLYDYRISESGMGYDPNVARAFFTIVLARKSVILMEYIERNLPQFSIGAVSLKDSYSTIGCLETADDLAIIRIFQERAQKDTGTDFRYLWKSLKTIGDARHSKLIEAFISSGIIDTSLLAVDQSPAGLNNIVEFEEPVVDVNGESLKVGPLESQQVEKDLFVHSEDLKEDVTDLIDLSDTDNAKPEIPCVNVEEDSIGNDEEATDAVSLKKVSKKLCSPKKVNHTAAVCKISADQFEFAVEMGNQQDVTECISNVLTQIESAMKPDELDENNEQLDMIKDLFFGKTKQRLVPVDKETKQDIPGGSVRTKIESFLNLIVNIGDHPKDIYDALDTFFTEDLLELEDGEVKRSLTIIELPKILQIQIQRVQFDRVKLIPVKSNDPIPFGEKLYMDRYLETDDETIINKRQEVFNWRRRVVELNERKSILTLVNDQGMTNKDVLITTRDFLKSENVKELGVTVDMNTLEILDLEIERIQTELEAINNELEVLQNNITQQFKGFEKIGYSIFAVFIHRGQASYGHYWIYIRDPKNNVYRKYNDEIVSEVTIEEVFNFAEGNTATPYYLTFIKDDLLDQITPLQRDVIVEEKLQELQRAGNNPTIEMEMDVD